LPTLVIAAIGWPLLFVLQEASLLPRLSSAVRDITGKGWPRQIWEQLGLAFWWSITPSQYYTFELFHDDLRRQAGSYLLRHQLKGGLHNLIARATSQAHSTSRFLNNKVLFAEHCRRHGLATIAPIMKVHGSGEITYFGNHSAVLPANDLFLKPVKCKGGRGCERWRYADGAYIGKNGERLDASGLIEYIKNLTKSRDIRSNLRRHHFLVQPCVANHPAIADLSTGALISARIMSCIDELGTPHVTCAVMKIVTGHDAIVDNFHGGGWVAAIDIKTGRLGPATNNGLTDPGTWLDEHPVTGAPIIGRELPYWADVVALVERAHGTLPDRIGIGWDVAITMDGPCLIEANNQWGLDMIQRTARAPIGDSRFAAMFAFHARRAEVALMSGEVLCPIGNNRPLESES
jgi:hypothetical protein